MDGKQVLLFIVLALIAWFVWVQFRDSEKRKELAARREREQQAARAKREAEEAERQRKLKAAEAEAWRVEVAEDKKRREAEKEKARRELQQERAEQQEQEKRDRQAAAAKRQAEEAEAERRAEAERAHQREFEENAQRQAEEERARQRGTADAARRLVEDERASIRAMPIAGDIHHTMREFLSNNQFFGEDHSPLAYVGYRVGVVNGLPPQERRRRLRACFQVEIPPQLAAKYQAWGPPVTSQRFTSMCQHIIMLANMRRARRNYEVTVSDWESDVQWFTAEYGSLAQRLHNARIG